MNGREFGSMLTQPIEYLSRLRQILRTMKDYTHEDHEDQVYLPILEKALSYTIERVMRMIEFMKICGSLEFPRGEGMVRGCS